MKRDIIIALVIGITIGSIIALTVTNLPTLIKEGKKRTEKISQPTDSPITLTPKINNLEIIKPLDGSISEADSTVVSGKTKSGNTVFIDTDLNTKIVETDGNETFSEKITLSEGANIIHVTQYDASGEVQSKVITVFYTAENLLSVKQTSSTSPSPASQSATSVSIIEKLKKIEILKENIASRVAEIREKDQAAYIGTIKTINSSSINLITTSGDKTINLSEDTSYFSLLESERKDISFKKLSEGNTISVFGYVNGEKGLFVKYVYLEPSPKNFILGKITDKDPDNFTITLKETEGNKIIDIETFTKISSYNKGKGLQKSGFSKLKVGDSVQITGKINSNKTDRISANKIYVIPNIDISQTVNNIPAYDTPIPIKPSITPSKTTKVSPTPTE